jgi:hypothetical protein
MAKAQPWYREAIPKFIIHFEQEIKTEAAKGSTWLRYAEKICEHIHTQSGRCSGSVVLPSYNLLGGPKGKGHVTFDRSMSQFLDAGPRTLNIATNGGLTIVAVVRFTGTPGDCETIFDLASGKPDNNIHLRRCGSSSYLALHIFDRTSKTVNLENAVIKQDTWLTVVVRYRASTRECLFTVNDDTYSGIANLKDRTVSGTLIGTSQWGSSYPYFNGDVAGVFVVDEYLSDGAVSAVTTSIEEGQDIDAALRALSEAQVFTCMNTRTHNMHATTFILILLPLSTQLIVHPVDSCTVSYPFMRT